MSVFFTSANTGTAVGGGGTILHTTNCGELWFYQGGETMNDLYAVSFVDSNIGTAVGDGGTILRTTDGGRNWVRQASGVTALLRAVAFTNADTGIVVSDEYGRPGDSAVILRTTDGGATWSRYFYFVSGTLNGLYAVSFSDANHVMVGSWDGTFFRSTNAGAYWITQENGVGAIIYLKFFDADTGIAMDNGGNVLNTTDGGIDWTRRDTDYEELYTAFFIDINTGISSGSFVDGTDGLLTRTTDGGTSWEWDDRFFWPNYYLHSLYFVNADTGFAVGDGGTILRTTNGGKSTGVKSDPFPIVPSEFSLAQNYPNPFTGSTTISYFLPQSENVALQIFTPLGNEVATLVHDWETAGVHTGSFTANTLPSGTYFVRASTAREAVMKKIFLVE